MSRFVLLLLCAAITGYWWLSASPPAGVYVESAYPMPGVSSQVLRVRDDKDRIADTASVFAAGIPGQDEIVFQPGTGMAYVTSQDGWIWQVHQASGRAERYVDVPMMPAGAHIHPQDPDTLFFCSSRFTGETYAAHERVGLYRLHIPSRRITPVVLDVPVDSGVWPPPPRVRSFHEIRFKALGGKVAGEGMRALEFCNDLDVSEDGQRIYFSEPFSYEGASMGGGAFFEAVTLGRNSRLWVVRLDENDIGLVADGFNFIDGVLIEPEAGRESSVLVTETTRFRLLRLHLAGPRAASWDVLHEYLPYMPDGMDCDEAGNIWIGMIKQRSGLITWLHANPWIKPLILRIPPSFIPVRPDSAVMALSADASRVLYYTEHDGSKVPDISVAVPHAGDIYIPSFNRDQLNLYRFSAPVLK